MIQLSGKLDELMIENNVRIQPIGKYQLQDWIDWLLLKTQRSVTKKDLLEAIDNFERNWSKLQSPRQAGEGNKGK